MFCLTVLKVYAIVNKVVLTVPKTVGAEGYKTGSVSVSPTEEKSLFLKHSVLPSLGGFFYKLLSAKNLKGGKESGKS